MKPEGRVNGSLSFFIAFFFFTLDKLKDNRVRWGRTLKREFRALRPEADDTTLETLVFQWKGILLAYGHSKRLLDDEAARAQATAAYRMLIGG